MVLESISVKDDDRVVILDQLQLPSKQEYIPVDNSKDAWDAIYSMKTRGAPMIAIVALFGLAKELLNVTRFESDEQFLKKLNDTVNYLKNARPTAVNIFTMLDYYENEIKQKLHSLANQTDRFTECCRFVWLAAKNELEKDRKQNYQLSQHASKYIQASSPRADSKYNILTICNTGSLATAGYGTALGVVRSLHESDRIEMVYCTETRPYNQGSRLTAFELVHDNIPGTLICDNMVTALMSTTKIDAVIVGADRITSNGDCANKIGTFQLAVLAKHFNVPFYVACTLSSFDWKTPTGKDIRIEERNPKEIKMIGNVQNAPDNIRVWNPSFDVTPFQMIHGYFTEVGVLKPDQLHTIRPASN